MVIGGGEASVADMLTLPLGDEAKGSVVQGHSLLQSTFEDNLLHETLSAIATPPK